jgi:hypothetical protein
MEGKSNIHTRYDLAKDTGITIVSMEITSRRI